MNLRITLKSSKYLRTTMIAKQSCQKQGTISKTFQDHTITVITLQNMRTMML